LIPMKDPTCMFNIFLTQTNGQKFQSLLSWTSWIICGTDYFVFNADNNPNYTHATHTARVLSAGGAWWDFVHSTLAARNSLESMALGGAGGLGWGLQMGRAGWVTCSATSLHFFGATGSSGFLEAQNMTGISSLVVAYNIVSKPRKHSQIMIIFLCLFCSIFFPPALGALPVVMVRRGSRRAPVNIHRVELGD